MVSFATDLVPFFDEILDPIAGKSAQQCMIAGAIKKFPDGTRKDMSFDLHDYDAVKNRANDIQMELESCITTNGASGMPPGNDGFASRLLPVFIQWINQGCPR